MCRYSWQAQGFTLAELLVVVVIVGILGAAAFPLLSSGDPQKLAVAAGETANFLRFALAEARRTGGYVLVDGKTTSGKIALYYSNANAEMPPTAGTSSIPDPLTKRAAVLDVGASSFPAGVTLAVKFRASSGPVFTQALIGPGVSQIRLFDGPSNPKGLLFDSTVDLTFGGKTVSVNWNAAGLVTLP